MKSYIFFNTVLVITVVAVLLLVLQLTENRYIPQQMKKLLVPTATPTPLPTLEFTSIDTMKYSRDPSREFLTSKTVDALIDTQVKNIAKTNVKYVAIATPYDDEFLPILSKWVKAARKYKLHVWFRGNFSGWEGWFGYGKIDRVTHKQKVEQFITNNLDFFQNGDIFTPCPECENGGPGDPRRTGDVAGFRAFMIGEYTLTQKLFQKRHKTVYTNLASMNYDVANLVMDKPTTVAMGGIVTVDHYVKSADKLANDLDILAQKTGGKVVLGEFGAPIPDIHGSMTPQEQADWIQLVLANITKNYQVIGVNYWVNVGGSTQIWGADGTPSPAVDVISAVFSRYKH